LIEGEPLQQYIATRRWFGLKDQIIKSARIVNLTDIGERGREILLTEIEVKASASTTRWQLPLAILWEDEPSAALPNRLALARVRRGRRLGLLTDAFALPDFARRVVIALAQGRAFENSNGVLRFQPTDSSQQLLHQSAEAEVKWITAEQSNSSLTIGDSVMLKLFRRVSAGKHPEAEMTHYLTAAGFANAPPLLGEIVQISEDSRPYTLAIALGFVRNQGDGWSWILDRLMRALDSLAPNDSEFDVLTDCEAIVAAIGRHLGEMHAVLAQHTSDVAFAAKIADARDAATWVTKVEQRLEKAFSVIEQTNEWSRDQDSGHANMLLKVRAKLATTVKDLARSGTGTLMTRIHGDFHLGQVLIASGDVYIIDFEGEPSASTEERRAKTSPMRDVAGLLRSIDYACAAVLEGKGVASGPIDETQRDRLIAEFRALASRAFLNNYWTGRGSDGSPAERALLDLFLIEKAAYEIAYEAASRPTWIGVPLAGLAALAKRILVKDAGGRNG
jgi:maltose alpha-D-glucosyltransferase/alpha-amylase